MTRSPRARPGSDSRAQVEPNADRSWRGMRIEAGGAGLSKDVENVSDRTYDR